MTKKQGNPDGMGGEKRPGRSQESDPGTAEREGNADKTRRDQIDQNKDEAEDSLPVPKGKKD